MLRRLAVFSPRRVSFSGLSHFSGSKSFLVPKNSKAESSGNSSGGTDVTEEIDDLWEEEEMDYVEIEEGLQDLLVQKETLLKETKQKLVVNSASDAAEPEETQENLSKAKQKLLKIKTQKKEYFQRLQKDDYYEMNDEEFDRVEEFTNYWKTLLIEAYVEPSTEHLPPRMTHVVSRFASELKIKPQHGIRRSSVIRNRKYMTLETAYKVHESTKRLLEAKERGTPDVNEEPTVRRFDSDSLELPNLKKPFNKKRELVKKKQTTQSSAVALRETLNFRSVISKLLKPVNGNIIHEYGIEKCMFYLLNEMFLSYSVSRRVLREVQTRIPCDHFSSFLDFGAATGPGLWAAHTVFNLDDMEEDNEELERFRLGKKKDFFKNRTDEAEKKRLQKIIENTQMTQFSAIECSPIMKAVGQLISHPIAFPEVWRNDEIEEILAMKSRMIPQEKSITRDEEASDDENFEDVVENREKHEELHAKLDDSINVDWSLNFEEVKPKKHNVVHCSFVLGEINSEEGREVLIRSLWNQTQDVLVIIDTGDSEGFARVEQVRRWILEWSPKRAYIIAPCGHHKKCPLAKGSTVQGTKEERERYKNMSCIFGQSVPTHQFPAKSVITKKIPLTKEGRRFAAEHLVKFSYLVIGKSNRNFRNPRRRTDLESVGRFLNDDRAELPTQKELDLHKFKWDRVVAPPLKRGGHIVLDRCQAEDGLMKREVITEGYKVYDRVKFKVAKKLAWGDLYPGSYFDRELKHEE